MNELPADEDPTWQFMALSTDTPLTQHELPVYLKAAERPGVERWIVLEPLDRDDYSAKTRVLDLVHRMMTAKMHGAEGIFVKVGPENETSQPEFQRLLSQDLEHPIEKVGSELRGRMSWLSEET